MIAGGGTASGVAMDAGGRGRGGGRRTRAGTVGCEIVVVTIAIDGTKMDFKSYVGATNARSEGGSERRKIVGGEGGALTPNKDKDGGHACVSEANEDKVNGRRGK